MIKFMLITNDPILARHAEECGVGRVFVDLEHLGKRKRQGHLDTFISKHSMSDVAKVRAGLNEVELLVRVNPLHDQSRQEVDSALRNGADLLMLPMFHRSEEVRKFVELVDGRAGVIPLVETQDAVNAIHEIVAIQGLHEIYIGLNDLHLDMKMSFMFEPLANGLVEKIATTIKEAGLPFGFGGIARLNEGVIPGELVLSEHLRLGSSSVILSRSFYRQSGDESIEKNLMNLKEEIKKLTESGKRQKMRKPAQIEEDKKRVQDAVAEYVSRKS